MDTISEQRLAEVFPLLATKIRAMAGTLPFDVRVTQGLRTWEEQDALYAKGRTTPGPKVTNAAGGYSYHNFGLAVDLVPMTALGPDWNAQDPMWKAMIAAGQAAGLTPGALWRTFPDMPHFQITGSLPQYSPDDAVRQIYRTGGIAAVWQATGLNTQPEENS